jgi:biopolymer transport protein TolR
MPITKARLKISDYNEQRKAQLKRNAQRIRVVSLSLTSMVDMFAILTIFLLVNAGAVTQWIELGHGIHLPKAKFADPPQKALVIQLSNDTLYGERQPILSMQEIMKSNQLTLPAMQQWLLKQGPRKDSFVNMVADEKVPFGAMKKIIATCKKAGFENVNLAVQPKA